MGFCLKSWIRRLLIVLVGTGLAIALPQVSTLSSQATLPSTSPSQPPYFTESFSTLGNLQVRSSHLTHSPLLLPPLRPHPLPPTLARWQDTAQSGDYFDQVKSVRVGYLIWSSFPVTIFIEPLTAEEARYPFATSRAETWITAISQAVQEWNPYLPLQIVPQAEGADITMRRSPPPLRLDPDDPAPASTSGRPTLPLSRARSAETRFELYLRQVASTAPSETGILAHRFTIYLRPDQAISYIQAAARHEIGHALGIWGHSPLQTDALYFSQVRNSSPISNRDINTLKRVYEQPTRVGWTLPQ